MNPTSETSTHNWDQYYQHSPDHIIIINNTFEIVYINRTDPHLCKDKVIGTNISSWALPQDKDSLLEKYHKVFTDQKSTYFRVRAANSGAWYDVAAGPMAYNNKHYVLITTHRSLFGDKKTEHDINNDNKLEYQPFAGILTQDSHMQQLLLHAQALAEHQEPVLISGESGTGKLSIARALHQAAKYGGEFYMASDERPLAELLTKPLPGTLYVPNANSLSGDNQGALFQLLKQQDSGSYTHCRLLVSTSESLATKVEAGIFNQQLFFRLHLHHIHLPPLRERRSDIDFLFRHFLLQASATTKRPCPEIQSKHLQLLSNHDWPGNITEIVMLANALVSRAGKSNIDKLIQEHCQQHKKDVHIPTIAEMQEELVLLALASCGQNYSEAARRLGITRQGLYKMVKRFNKKADEG